MNIQEFLHELNLDANNYGTSTGSQWLTGSGNYLASHSPVNGQLIANAEVSTAQNYGQVIQTAQQAYAAWRTWPAPRRGEVVRQYGNLLREHKNALGHLVSYEMGKSLQEGLGEVQEMIDICDFAVGLSRQLYGLTMHSERPMHRMYEQWHPLGIIGIISAFNFPVAVWSWNAAIAWVCGNVCVWKPSEKTPLTAIACQKLAAQVFANNDVPDGVSCLIMGNYEVGQWLTSDERVPLISATGSTRMGKLVGQTVAGRLGRSLLELGGNNAIIISESANMQLLVGAVFGAVGTCGQRCTTTRRLIIHGSVYEKVKTALIKAYNQLRIGNPLDANNHVGPLIDLDAVKNYLAAIEAAKQQGGDRKSVV